MALTTKSTRHAISELEEHKKALLETRRKTDEEIVRTDAALIALRSLESDEPVEFDGPLAEAVRLVLKKNADRSLAPTDVRDEVKVLGFDFGKLKHDNPMAAIHGVLKRLLESGEARPKKAKDGSTRYVWNGPRDQYITVAPIPSTAKLMAPSINPAIEQILSQSAVHQITTAIEKKFAGLVGGIPPVPGSVEDERRRIAKAPEFDPEPPPNLDDIVPPPKK
jgi:hypothetical protein